MPVKGIDQVKRKYDAMIGKITGQLSERTVTQVLIIGQGHAHTMTPVDTSNLVNSQYRRVTPTDSGVIGMVGYTANYASAVHWAAGTLKGKPRPDGKGVYWGPDGEPQFLRKGFEENGKAEIQQAIKRGMKI